MYQHLIKYTLSPVAYADELGWYTVCHVAGRLRRGNGMVQNKAGRRGNGIVHRRSPAAIVTISARRARSKFLYMYGFQEENRYLAGQSQSADRYEEVFRIDGSGGIDIVSFRSILCLCAGGSGNNGSPDTGSPGNSYPDPEEGFDSGGFLLDFPGAHSGELCSVLP